MRVSLALCEDLGRASSGRDLLLPRSSGCSCSRRHGNEPENAITKNPKSPLMYCLTRSIAARADGALWQTHWALVLRRSRICCRTPDSVA